MVIIDKKRSKGHEGVNKRRFELSSALNLERNLITSTFLRAHIRADKGVIDGQYVIPQSVSP